LNSNNAYFSLSRLRRRHIALKACENPKIAQKAFELGFYYNKTKMRVLYKGIGRAVAGTFKPIETNQLFEPGLKDPQSLVLPGYTTTAI